MRARPARATGDKTTDTGRAGAHKGTDATAAGTTKGRRRERCSGPSQTMTSSWDDRGGASPAQTRLQSPPAAAAAAAADTLPRAPVAVPLCSLPAVEGLQSRLRTRRRLAHRRSPRGLAHRRSLRRTLAAPPARSLASQSASAPALAEVRNAARIIARVTARRGCALRRATPPRAIARVAAQRPRKTARSVASRRM